MAQLKNPIVINSEFIKEVVRGITDSADFKDSGSSEDYKKGFLDFAETLISTLEKINKIDLDAETPCDRCKHFIKEATEYPCKYCRNCYTNKFELDEGKVENG